MGLGNEDQEPYPQACLLLSADLNQGPHNWWSYPLLWSYKDNPLLHNSSLYNSHLDKSPPGWLPIKTIQH